VPSIAHEAAVELLHRNPQLAATLLASAGVRIPAEATAVLADSNLSVPEPTELRADVVTVHDGLDGRLAIVTEVQKDPPDVGKRRAWVAYVALAQVEHKCDAALVVIALDAERRETYTRLIRATASQAVRQALEELMATVFKDEFIDGLLDRGRAEGKTEGRAEGEAAMLLRVLAARGFTVPDAIRQRILSCTDLAQLEAWGDRAVTVNSVDEIFSA
jgi:hypothetical protein